MPQRNLLPPLILAALFFVILSVLFIFVLPLNQINWGSMRLGQERTITVTGMAEGAQSNQIARFQATVEAEDPKKQPAVSQVNTNMEEIIKQVKAFGIDEEDLQTSNLSVRQIEKYERGGIPLDTPIKVWRASNSLEITLRDVERASSLADLLFASGATNVYGPRLSVDNTTQAETELLIKAVANAREKAEKLAEASGARLGKVITLNEDTTQRPTPPFPVLMRETLQPSAPVEPGTTTLTKTVTVTFELK